MGTTSSTTAQIKPTINPNAPPANINTRINRRYRIPHPYAKKNNSMNDPRSMFRVKEENTGFKGGRRTKRAHSKRRHTCSSRRK
jgi:hypothetical protein